MVVRLVTQGGEHMADTSVPCDPGTQPPKYLIWSRWMFVHLPQPTNDVLDPERPTKPVYERHGPKPFVATEAL